MKPYELTPEEYANFPQKEEYDRAIRYCNNEHARCGNGWAEGHDLLEKLGWKKIERQIGHRTYEALEKPSQIVVP